MKKQHETNRACVACKEGQNVDSAMLRIVLMPDFTLGFDVRARLPGRGAWVCAQKSCLEIAVKRGAFNRSFSSKISCDLKEFVSDIQNSLEKCLVENLSLAVVAQLITIGSDEVKKESLKKNIFMVLYAKDLSSKSYLHEPDCDCLAVEFNKEFFGNVFKRKPTGVVGLKKGRITIRIVNDLKRYASLFSV